MPDCPDEIDTLDTYFPHAGDATYFGENEANEEAESVADLWEEMRDEDRAYMLGPHNFPVSCFFCGGRATHNPNCCVVPKFPFGKYKGKAVSQVPRDYLRWLLRNGVSMKPDLRAAVEARAR